jgi:hypothetical protein
LSMRLGYTPAMSDRPDREPSPAKSMVSPLRAAPAFPE